MKQLWHIGQFIKNNERLLLYVALLLCVVFWHRSCQETKTKTINVEVPKIQGNFASQQPNHQTINIDSLRQSIKQNLHPEVIYLNQITEVAELKTDSLLAEYQNLQTEYERFKLFQTFVSTKQFNQTFEDEYIITKVQGVVRGEVESLTLDYTLKPRTITHELEVPKKKRFSVGPYVGYDLIQLQPSLGISINYGLIRF